MLPMCPSNCRMIRLFQHPIATQYLVSIHLMAWWIDIDPLVFDGSSRNWNQCCRGISWWRHQMETFSALLALCAGNSSVPVKSPHKGQWRGALLFCLICAWINDWVNNREAGDLRGHCGHYDVNVIFQVCFITLHEMRELFTSTQSYTFDVNKGGIGKSVVDGHKDRRWFNPVLRTPEMINEYHWQYAGIGLWTHWEQMTHMCVIELCRHWVR